MMSYNADFETILDQIGQSITIRTITRTVNPDGDVTAVLTSDTTTSAIVQEVGWKEKIYIESGLVSLGDLMFFLSNDETITQYDKIVWNATIYNIRKILAPPRYAGEVIFKQVMCVQDSIE